MGLGLHKELQSKIATFVGLGSVVSLTHLKDHVVLKYLSKFYLVELAIRLGFKAVLLLPKNVSQAMGVLIYNSWFHHNIMLGLVNLLCGFPKTQKVSP